MHYNFVKPISLIIINFFIFYIIYISNKVPKMNAIKPQEFYENVKYNLY